MTHRERLGSAAAIEATERTNSVADDCPKPFALPSAWEEIYRGASPAKQRELLALARNQGQLYAHQIASAVNGAQGMDPAERLLTALFGDHPEDLDPVRTAKLPAMVDPSLDAAQREAVARALETPDICLLQGLPGTGKSRVVAEVVMQAVNRGDRVLL